MDKTGTLTLGRPAVTEVVPVGSALRDEILLLACSLDANSNHPLATAILKAGPDSGVYMSVTKFETLLGRGVKGCINEAVHYPANHRLIEELGVCSPEVESVCVPRRRRVILQSCCQNGDGVLGVIAVFDGPRPEAAESIRRLAVLGVTTVVLTG